MSHWMPMMALALLLAAPEAIAAEKFQKLNGAQIRARLSGMEITDGTHWADVYAADGRVMTYSMGRKTAGTWRVQDNELCVDRGAEDKGCREVWVAGKNVELRRAGSQVPLEGVLQRPAQRR